MRRLVLVCLLLVLPLQWPWAAVPGACCRDCACAAEHLAAGRGGHAPADLAGDAPDAGAVLDVAGGPCEADCQHCQGPGPAVLVGAPASPGPSICEQHGGRYARHLADPIPDHPLRPPQA